MTTQATHTPGPWQWTAGEDTDQETYESTPRPVDMATWQSTGYSDNPMLYGGDGTYILSAGHGEYSPVHGKDQAQCAANARLIAAAPEMLELLRALSAAIAPTREGKRDGGTFGRLSTADDHARAFFARLDGAA